MENNYTFTENGDLTRSTSGDANLDFFTRITRNATYSDYIQAFVDAWDEDRETAIQVLMNLRDIRTGKGEKLIPIAIMTFLRFNIDNSAYEALLERMLDQGCWKDLLRIHELVCRITDDYRSSFCPEITMFVKQLEIDFAALNSDTSLENKTVAISLCAKWAPSENGRFNRRGIRAAKLIAEKMGMGYRTYRIMLCQMRRHLNVLETLMSTQQYDKIDFSRIPSVAMMKTKHAFNRTTNANGITSDARKKLQLSYNNYLSDLKNGKTKVNVQGIQPHELVSSYMRNHKHDELIEQQWKTLRQKVLDSGSFRDVTAIVDVSGSMYGQPLEVAVALGLLVAECTLGPYHGRVLTFHSNPTWHIIQGSTLLERVRNLYKAKWGGSTNLRASFDLILKQATDAQLSPDEMVKTLFVFTDMQFDSACNGEEIRSTFEYARQAYNQAGYELPKIVCWNLRTSSSKSLPLSKDEDGYAMLSGFSSELLECILNAEKFNPYSVMKHILEPYLVPNEIISMGDRRLNSVAGLEQAITNSAIKSSYKKPIPASQSISTEDSTNISLASEEVTRIERYGN